MSARPPLLARVLLAFRVPAAHREFVTGDLNETFEQMAVRSGVRAARRWYWHEALLAAFTRWPKSSVVTCQRPRGDSPVHTLVQDLRFGGRLLSRSPGFAAVAVLTLGMGIGANTTIFSWINSVLLTPIPGAADTGRLVEFSQTFQGSQYSLSYPDYADYRAGTKLLSGLAARDEQALHISVDGVPERAWAELVSANFFDVLGVRPALGRAFLPEEDRTPGAAPVAVISYGLWQRRFGGDPAVVSRPVEINGHAFTIVGVTPVGFQGSQTALSYDLWVPMMMQPVIMPGASRLVQRDNHWLTAFGRLAPGVSVAQARSEMEGITRQLVKGRPESEDFSVRMALLRDSSDGAVSVLRPVLLALAIVVGLVLVIACANLANLMIAPRRARS